MASASSAAGIRPSTWKRLQIEHHHRLVVARGGKSVARPFGDGRAVRALNAGDLAEQLAGIFIHHHHAILARDEQTVMGGSGTT